MRKILYWTFATTSVFVLVASGQVAAFTRNDIDCIKNNNCFYSPDACGVPVINPGDVTGGNLVPDDQIPGKDSREKIWNYLISLGFSPVEAAGIEGNIGREGVYDPQSIEDGNEKWDPQLHQLVGRTKNYEVFKQLTTPGQDGYGLIGFTPGLSLMEPGKKDPTGSIGGGANWSAIAEVDVTKDNFYYMSTQLSVVLGYMKNSKAPDGKNMLEEYKNKATSPGAAASAFQDLVENAGVVADGIRDQYANDAMDDFGHGTPESVPSGGAAGGGGCCPGGGGGGDAAAGVALTGDSPGEQVFNYFVNNEHFSNTAAAAITGNLEQESGFSPTIDNGAGYVGLAQWGGSRLTKLQGKEDWQTLGVQLKYISEEMRVEGTSWNTAYHDMKRGGNIEDLTYDWVYYYEGAVDASQPRGVQDYDTRLTYAKQWLQKSGGGDAAGGGGCGGVSGTAFVLGDYAWPVDIKKSEVDSGYSWPCPGNCHHDGTPAFDLSTKKAVGGDDADVVGRAEFAITDGTISFMEIYAGQAGCYLFYIDSSTDGYTYAYIHAGNPAVQVGDKVKVGQKVAEVGRRDCTGNGSYPHLHIDRGAPKGGPAGLVCCRDPGLVPIINKLYENLPNN